MNISPRDVANWCLRMSRAQAEELIKQAGYQSRVVSDDGIQYAGAADFRPNRINLTLIDGIVVEVSVG